MGRMPRGVSRRVAIGAIVGGLAGSAAVVAALKGRSRAPRNNLRPYAAQWERDRKLVEMPVRTSDGPAHFELNYRPQVGDSWRALCLYASYEKEDYPRPPQWHSIAHGQLTATSPIVGERTALRVVGQDHRNVYAAREVTQPVGECLVVPKMAGGIFDGFSYYNTADGAAKEVSAAQVNSACRSVADTVMFNYPPGRTLAIGSRWTVPEGFSHSVALPCEVVGFAEIAGRTAAKVSAEQHLDNRQYQQYIARSWRDAEKSGFAPPSDAEIRAEQSAAAARELRFNVRIAFYLDLNSGICLRNEAVLGVSGPSYDHTIVQISQVTSV